MAKPKRRDEHWIEHMHMKEGLFSGEAKREGKSTAELAEEKEDAPGKEGRRARLAESLLKLQKRRK